MFRMLKNLLPRETLPAHIHFHLDDDGNQVWCDASACRPTRRPDPLFLPSGR